MSKIFVSVGVSLDGFMAGLNGGPQAPLGEGGLAIHEWVFKQQIFRQHLGLGDDGETGKDNDIAKVIFERIGANILGKNMFVEGEANWPEDAPFHCPVFVLTHEIREPWVRKGGTTFYFENDGVYSALEKAKAAAGDKDIRISGGANVIQQYLNAGLIEELIIHQVPLLLGKGVRLFENLDTDKFSFEIIEAINSSEVTHIRYKVINK
ncbi:dihydrofolate reductase family protein [Solitalea sp. MAHUQ-68]|uniref:Dihydrofolate reductase family protein n=1 Tax=Solitalea agri TaxID=2953739 RepID=A0A9X2F8K6_9SPHI|nr:dihydrofolate reductase family protein [Solitalea agri]MCO4292528.1 dihydrofolate reductase family protein [Solitalea agri]